VGTLQQVYWLTNHRASSSSRFADFPIASFEFLDNTGAGNAPLGWNFYYGPLSAAIGEIIALIQWSIRIIALSDDR
jgi:hypothetical protein